jgi:hypothetical protein
VLACRQESWADKDKPRTPAQNRVKTSIATPPFNANKIDRSLGMYVLGAKLSNACLRSCAHFDAPPTMPNYIQIGWLSLRRASRKRSCSVDRSICRRRDFGCWCELAGECEGQRQTDGTGKWERSGHIKKERKRNGIHAPRRIASHGMSVIDPLSLLRPSVPPPPFLPSFSSSCLLADSLALLRTGSKSLATLISPDRTGKRAGQESPARVVRTEPRSDQRFAGAAARHGDD